MSINQSINQYYCDNFHVQNLFPEYLHLVGEIFTSRSPSDPDIFSMNLSEILIFVENSQS